MKNVSNNKSKSGKDSSENPFTKMIEDKKRIIEAIKKGEDLSKIKGIRFAFPI